MVSLRCKMIMQEELSNLRLYFGKLDLGTIEISEDRQKLRIRLLKYSLEFIKNTEYTASFYKFCKK